MNRSIPDIEEIKKCCDLIGRDIYLIEKPYENRPYIISFRVLMVEVSAWTIRLAGPNKYLNQYNEFYFTREEAEKALQEKIKESTVHIDPLLPCPVCGSRAEIKEYSYDYIVRCSECGLQTEAHKQMRVAIKRWNERKKAAE